VRKQLFPAQIQLSPDHAFQASSGGWGAQKKPGKIGFAGVK